MVSALLTENNTNSTYLVYLLSIPLRYNNNNNNNDNASMNNPFDTIYNKYYNQYNKKD